MDGPSWRRLPFKDHYVYLPEIKDCLHIRLNTNGHDVYRREGMMRMCTQSQIIDRAVRDTLYPEAFKGFGPTRSAFYRRPLTP